MCSSLLLNLLTHDLSMLITYSPLEVIDISIVEVIWKSKFCMGVGRYFIKGAPQKLGITGGLLH